MPENTRIVLAATPHGELTPDAFRFETAPTPELAEGEFLVAVKYLSIDPTIRTWIAYDTYLPKIQVGEVIRSLGAGEVVDTRNPKYPVGTRVSTSTNWQAFAVAKGGQRIPDDIGYEQALSVFGMTGLTAYVGLIDIGRPRPGETVVVSGAAGAVGSLAGQIAKALGCTVIGIAGTAQKCSWVVDDLGFDACIDYREENVARRLRALAPKGIDVYFDNVGGETLNTVLGQIRDHARIVLCGSISDYNSSGPAKGPANLINAISRRALLQGFIVLDHYDRAGEANAAMAQWLREGKLVSQVDVTDGLDQAPQAVAGLFTGRNLGKSLVRVAP
jgi:NADPH-dependent curcumin reductase